MLERVKRSGRALVVGAVLAAGSVAGAAIAAHAPATDIAISSSVMPAPWNADTWINAAESVALNVTGKYTPSATPGNDRIRVQIVNSASCNAGVSELTVVKTASTSNGQLNSGAGTFSVPFNLSTDGQIEVTNPFDPTAPVQFTEGATLCALVRVSHDSGVQYGELNVNAVKPRLDRTVDPGTVALIQPAASRDQFMNAAETDPDPVNPSDSAISKEWTAGPSDISGYAEAATWIADHTSAKPADCGTEPAALTPDDPAFAPPPSGSAVLPDTCTTAIAESPLTPANIHDQVGLRARFALNGRWTDVAGNVSALATPDTLIKDTLAPDVRPCDTDATDVDTGCLSLNKADKITTAPNDHLDPELETGYQGNRKSYLTLGTSEVDSTVEQTMSGGTTIRRTKIAVNQIGSTLDAKVFFRDDVSGLSDGAVTIDWKATDLAGNSSTDDRTVEKDTTPPGAPAVTVSPTVITGLHQTDVEVTIAAAEATAAGDLDPAARIIIDDIDPNTSAIEIRTIIENGTTPTIPVDVSSLENGPVTVTVDMNDRELDSASNPPLTHTPIACTDGNGLTLEDATLLSIDFRTCGNIGAKTVVGVTKNATIPVAIVKPAAGSLNKAKVRFTGNAMTAAQLPPGTPVITHVEIREGGNRLLLIPVDTTTGAWPAQDLSCPDPNPLNSIHDDPFCKGDYTYDWRQSGTHQVRARALDSSGTPVGNMSPVRTFDVDGINPASTIRTPTSSVFLPGQSVTIEGNATDNMGLLTVQAKVFNVRGQEVVNPSGYNATCDGGCTGKKNASWAIDLNSLAPGYYVVQIRAWDRALNEQVTAGTISFLKV